MESLGKAGLGGGDGIVDAAAVAVAGDGAVGVPALAARLRGAADAEALAAVVVSEAGEDLLGGELGDLVCKGRRGLWLVRTHGVWRRGPDVRNRPIQGNNITEFTNGFLYVVVWCAGKEK